MAHLWRERWTASTRRDAARRIRQQLAHVVGRILPVGRGLKFLGQAAEELLDRERPARPFLALPLIEDDHTARDESVV